MNDVKLIGRLTKKPELEYTAGNTPVTKFTIAVDRKKKEDGADFIRTTVYGKQAENICRYMDKGRQVAISGRIQTGSYEKDGKKIYTIDIIGDHVEFLGSSNNEPVSNKESYHNYGSYSEPPTGYRRYEEDIF